MSIKSYLMDQRANLKNPSPSHSILSTLCFIDLFILLIYTLNYNHSVKVYFFRRFFILAIILQSGFYAFFLSSHAVYVGLFTAKIDCTTFEISIMTPYVFLL